MDKKKILVVDDDELITEFIKDILNEPKIYDVFIKYDGQQAIEYLTDNDVDLVITDYKMPNMNGNEFLKKLRDSSLTAKTVPVIFLTAFEDREKWNEANHKTQPVVAYLHKPINEKLLLETVASAFVEQKFMEEEFDRVYIERQKDFYFAKKIESGEIIVDKKAKEFLTGGILS